MAFEPIEYIKENKNYNLIEENMDTIDKNESKLAILKDIHGLEAMKTLQKEPEIAAISKAFAEQLDKAFNHVKELCDILQSFKTKSELTQAQINQLKELKLDEQKIAELKDKIVPTMREKIREYIGLNITMPIYGHYFEAMMNEGFPFLYFPENFVQLILESQATAEITDLNTAELPYERKTNSLRDPRNSRQKTLPPRVTEALVANMYDWGLIADDTLDLAKRALTGNRTPSATIPFYSVEKKEYITKVAMTSCAPNLSAIGKTLDVQACITIEPDKEGTIRYTLNEDKYKLHWHNRVTGIATNTVLQNKQEVVMPILGQGIFLNGFDIIYCYLEKAANCPNDKMPEFAKDQAAAIIYDAENQCVLFYNKDENIFGKRYDIAEAVAMGWGGKPILNKDGTPKINTFDALIVQGDKYKKEFAKEQRAPMYDLGLKDVNSFIAAAHLKKMEAVEPAQRTKPEEIVYKNTKKDQINEQAATIFAKELHDKAVTHGIKAKIIIWDGEREPNRSKQLKYYQDIINNNQLTTLTVEVGNLIDYDNIVIAGDDKTCGGDVWVVEGGRPVEEQMGHWGPSVLITSNFNPLINLDLEAKLAEVRVVKAVQRNTAKAGLEAVRTQGLFGTPVVNAEASVDAPVQNQIV